MKVSQKTISQSQSSVKTWVTTPHKMAALCHKMVAEQNGGSSVCSGKGLPVVRYFG